MENINIRMILCDVDGTLLKKGASSIPEDVFEAILKATEHGIQFVVASGRCFPDLKKMFAPVTDKVSFICNDGALAVSGGNTIFNANVKKEQISSLYNVLSFSDREGVVLYGKDRVYCIGNNPLPNVFESKINIDSINEDIYKMAFYNLSPFQRQKIESFVNRSLLFTEVYIDALWTEFVSYGIHKGVAAATLQSIMNISPMETAAFGDNLNDFGMFRQSRLSFSAPDAVPDVQRICKFSTKNVAQEIMHMIQ